MDGPTAVATRRKLYDMLVADRLLDHGLSSAGAGRRQRRKERGGIQVHADGLILRRSSARQVPGGLLVER